MMRHQRVTVPLRRRPRRFGAPPRGPHANIHRANGKQGPLLPGADGIGVLLCLQRTDHALAVAVACIGRADATTEHQEGGK